MREYAMSAAEIEDIPYHRGGLAGVSGTSSDMRSLLASGDPPAHEAVDLFIFRAAREIGALTASLGGLDGLVFTAGIGEHAPEIRSRICARCAWPCVHCWPAAIHLRMKPWTCSYSGPHARLAR
jgi:acetate kinase